ncbi:MAG: hypothetical protein ACR2PJ_00655 [Pseudomonadales bacterium]
MKNLKAFGTALGIAALVLVLAGCDSYCPAGSEYNPSTDNCEAPRLVCSSAGVCREYIP